MDVRMILSRIDHTLLRPTAAWPEIETLCREAETFRVASACIPPWYVRAARAAFPALRLCTVIGFPNGYNTSEVKVFETKRAMTDGADEIDMVISLAALKSGDMVAVAADIEAVRDACADRVLKVIVETCYLTEEEKIALCRIVTDCGADFIKTSTGFGSAGAALEDIALFRSHIGPRVAIKAAGGIRTLEDLALFFEAGCERIGSSSAISLLCGTGD